MKYRESGMPEESLWETLFNVPLILDHLGIDQNIRDVVEIGCGYGTFTIPVAERITGTVLALDIDAAMIQRTRERAVGFSNVVLKPHDISDELLDIPPVDGCLLFNLLHGEGPVELLSKCAALVKPGGYVWAIHWRYDPATPRGPSMSIRPQPEQLAQWAEETGRLKRVGPVIDLPPWHYGWKFQRLARG